MSAMELYVAMVDDRHTDPYARLFTTPERAIDYARRLAEENAARPQDVEESEVEGWLYHATWSTEGDAVWVVPREVEN